jgi:hypothetical protein
LPRLLNACVALCLTVACVTSLWARAASAAGTDAAVKNAIAQTMDEYAKSKDSDKADGQLLEAIALCNNQCKPALLAQAWMYIGLVKGGGAKDWDSAREAFSVALGFDPKVELDPRFFSPTAQALFDGLKHEPTQADKAEVVPRFESGTQMGCWPLVQEVETFRPIPISCSTRVQGVDGVTLRYRQYGDDNWIRVDLKQQGDDWRGEIPCTALSRPGTWGMYIEAKDVRDNPLERIGSRDRPLVFKVVEKSSEPPPSLPGEAAPGRCVETAYCPEDMVGTPACEALKGAGAPVKKDTTCKAASDCDFGMSCAEGICKAPGVCTSDKDCGDGICQAGLCSERDRPGKMDWFGIQFGADLALLGTGTDACRTENPEYTCYDGGGELYDGTPYPGFGGTVGGGLHLGTLRVMLAYERFLLDNVSLGVRFGFAFSGAPDSFFPLHFEGRGTYYFADVTKGKSMWAPYIALGVGLAQVDVGVDVEMVDCLPGAEMSCLAAPAVTQGLVGPGGSAQRRTLKAYKSLGKVFASISPGLMVQLSKELSGVANLSVLLMTEQERSTSLVLDIQPSLGLAVGF